MERELNEYRYSFTPTEATGEEISTAPNLVMFLTPFLHRGIFVVVVAVIVVAVVVVVVVVVNGLFLELGFV